MKALRRAFVPCWMTKYAQFAQFATKLAYLNKIKYVTLYYIYPENPMDFYKMIKLRKALA